MTLHALPDTSDHDLLEASLDDLMTENRMAAARQRALLTYYRRRVRAEQLRGDEDDPTHLTARQEVEVELSELWAMAAFLVRRQLNNAIWVDEHFGYLRDLALAGRIDPYRVSLIAETARHGLDTADEYAALARRLEPFLNRHLRPDGIVACSTKQLRNKLTYEIKILRAADAEARFEGAYANRDTVMSHGEYGISWLTLAGTTDQIQLAAHRLDLSARAARAAGDTRTIEQLKADLALDLLIKGATTDAPVPQYARPVVNLTVPIQTVMGLADHPGFLSGGQVIPAGLARTIAQQPGSTWHRMLTDEAGQAVEVSTTRYRPTRALWEQVVALEPTCFRSNCDRASTECDLDHREEWPEGPTSTSNLGPACRTDHRAKHSEGFALVQTPSGGFTFRTRAGFSHPLVQTEQPTLSQWEPVPTEIQYSATEMVQALTLLRQMRALRRHDRPDLQWEHDLWLIYKDDPAA